MEEQPSTLTGTFMAQVILFAPKTEISDESLEQLLQGIKALQQHIPCLVAVSAGENQSTRHRGLTHGIILHFASEERMRNALQQPIYRRMLEKVQKSSESLVILELPESIPFSVPIQHTQSPPSQPTNAPPPIRKHPSKARRSAPSPASETPPSRTVQSRVKDDALRTVDPRLTRIVIEQLDVDERDIIPSASLVEDLNADSLDLVEYIMSLEETFHITISDEDAERLTTIAETQEYLRAKGAL